MYVGIIWRPVLIQTQSCFCLKHNVSETELCLRLQLGQVDGDSTFLPRQVLAIYVQPSNAPISLLIN
jgi:hypothetical protein